MNSLEILSEKVEPLFKKIFELNKKLDNLKNTQLTISRTRKKLSQEYLEEIFNVKYIDIKVKNGNILFSKNDILFLELNFVSSVTPTATILFDDVQPIINLPQNLKSKDYDIVIITGKLINLLKNNKLEILSKLNNIHQEHIILLNPIIKEIRSTSAQKAYLIKNLMNIVNYNISDFLLKDKSFEFSLNTNDPINQGVKVIFKLQRYDNICKLELIPKSNSLQYNLNLQLANSLEFYTIYDVEKKDIEDIKIERFFPIHFNLAPQE